MLSRDDFQGPWAGLPVAWTEDDTFDEATYRGDVRRCCEAGVPGVYTGGTTGEFYAIDEQEFQAIARATVEECHARNTPAMIGCSSTYTLGAQRRAEFAAEIGADAIQVALPFWMEVEPDAVVPFFQQVATAADRIPLSIYETTRAKRTLTVEQHRAVHQTVPAYMMVKANAGTIGCSEDGCRQLSEFVNVFVGEHDWSKLGRVGANGCCSAMVYWNPRVCLEMWSALRERRWEELDRWHDRIAPLYQFLASEFSPRGFTDTAYDRMGGRAGGFLQTSMRCRAPYCSVTQADVDLLRRWYAGHLPEMLEL